MASLTVSSRQKGNPLLNSISQGSIVWSDSTLADYSIGFEIAALFLSLKYHRLHPDYFSTRIKNMIGNFNTRVLLVLVDIENPDNLISSLTSICLASNISILLAFSYEEAARWISSMIGSHNVSLEDLKASMDSPIEMAINSLHSLGISRKDAEKLIDSLGSVEACYHADVEVIAGITSMKKEQAEAFIKAFQE